MPRITCSGNLIGKMSLHQGLIESTGGLTSQEIIENFQGGMILVGSRADMIHGADDADLADPAQYDIPLAILGRLFGVGFHQLPRWPFQRAELFSDQS